MSNPKFGERQSRRSFLRSLAGVGLGSAVLPGCAGMLGGGAALPAADQIGVQLYTVRDQLDRDFEGTLERVAQIGYDKVEFAGLYNRTPAQVRARLDALGLRAPSAHVGVNALRDNLSREIETAKVLGHEYITAPSYPVPRNNPSLDVYRQAAQEFNRWGAALRDQGLRFAYHNHAWEFQPLQGGQTGYDLLLAETDPSLVEFELDLYWALFAGRDPVTLFQQHPGRFTMWHVKDMRDPQGEKAMAPVGQGTVDFARIFEHAGLSGMKHFFVEHDNAATTTGSLESIQASHQHLEQLLG